LLHSFLQRHARLFVLGGAGFALAGSEANLVIQNFNQLQPWTQQDILNFLRSL
jgi:hypothetical protein